MATHTKTQLKTALGEKYNYDSEKETPSEFLTALISRKQDELDNQQARFDEIKARIGTDAKEELKKEAIAWINDKAEEQDVIDNAGVEL